MQSSNRRSIAHRLRIRGALGTALLLVVAAISATAAYAALRATTVSPGNTVQSGTVKITDDDGGQAMLSLSNAALGATDTSCIKATSGGSLDSEVRHYGTVSGALAPYLTLKVTRGGGAAGFDNCTGFNPDATDYRGAGQGVLYEGKLSNYPSSWASGLTDPSTSEAAADYAGTVGGTPGLLSHWRLGDGAVVGDDFDDSAGTQLQNHTAETGASWTKHPASYDNIVFSNAGRVHHSSTGLGLYLSSATASSANYAVEADVHVKTLAGSGLVGVLGRLYYGPGTYDYQAGYNPATGQWSLVKYVNGAQISLGTYTQLLALGSTYRLTLEMNGTSIRVLIDGVARIAVTDGSVTQAGENGLYSGFGSAAPSDTTGIHLDNYRTTSLTTTATDSQGANNGTYNGGVRLNQTAGPAGGTNRAATFDGVDDYVRVARQIQDDFSIEFWFKSTQGLNTNAQWWGNAGLVDAEVSGSSNDFGVSLRSDGRVVAGTGPTDVSIVSSSAGYNDGNWHHVVFTRTRSSGALRLYVDGQSAGSATGGTTSLTGPANIDFGRILTGTNHFAGSLDEVAMYGTALSLDQVQSHYFARLGPETWTTSEAHDYKFQITLDNDAAALGKSGSATFQWEARNR